MAITNTDTDHDVSSGDEGSGYNEFIQFVNTSKPEAEEATHNNNNNNNNITITTTASKVIAIQQQDVDVELGNNLSVSATNSAAVALPASSSSTDNIRRMESSSSDSNTNTDTNTNTNNTIRRRKRTSQSSVRPLMRRASTTEERRNPFAVREGNLLTWSNVNMTLNNKQGEKRLLNNVWGEVPPGEITAIMGPSGAGKTSLLNILAGRSQTKPTLSITSDIRMNEYAVDPTTIEVRKHIAFVAQDDSLSFTATPREAIRFSAKLRLPRINSDEEIEELTKKMLAELGLVECADVMIGGELIKGISGGERKRTSVGLELVTKPSLVFLDEPTSGLDSYSAMQVIKVLKKIASAGCSVLFTIHQPSSEVFNSFDRLILLNKGMVMYQGSVANVPPYFAQHNHPVPNNYNPADWIMEVAQQYSQEQLLNEGFFAEDTRKLDPGIVAKGESELMDSLGMSMHLHANDDEYKGVGFWTEAQLLFVREVVHNRRNKKGVGARFAFTTFLSTLVGCIFFQVGVPDEDGGVDPARFNSHFGAMIMILMMSMFGTAMPTLLSFPEERPVFLREYSTNHYGTISYFISRLAMEALVTFFQILVLLLVGYNMVGLQSGFFRFFVIEYGLAMSSTAVAVLLGCAVEDPKMATEFLPLLFVPQLLFAGFFVRTDLIPKALQWAQYLCSLTYGVRLALLAEFGECAKKASPVGSEMNPCKQLLTVNQVDEDERGLYWGILWTLFIVFRLCGLILLRKKATKFY